MATNIERQEDSRANNETPQPEHQAGFECEFVKPPSGETQTECPVCLLVIREPHQVTCCGYSFCRTCIHQIKTNQSPCPSCKEEFTDYSDKRLKRTLYAFKVHCTHQKDGCEWTGELGQLDEHLNTNPEPGKQFDGCQLTQLFCAHCGEKKCRQEMEEHQNEHCTKRPISCEYCTVYKSHHDNVIHNHWPVCGSFPVQCPNDCGSTLQRQNLDRHVTEECPLTTISCDFVGCPVKLPRKDMSEHLRENLLTHISLLAASHTKQQATIAELVDENEMLKSKNENLEHNYHSEITILKDKIKKLENMVSSHTQEQAEGAQHPPPQETPPPHTSTRTPPPQRQAPPPQRQIPPPHTLIPVGPPTLVMSHIEQHKVEGDHWYSTPVYTHSPGYKICLKVEILPWGRSESVHNVQVSIHFMRGEFDDRLTWPFKGDICIQLVDQVKGQSHKKETVKYTDEEDNTSSRVVQGEVARYGKQAFTILIYNRDHDTSRYLKNDTLVFQIYSVKLNYT